MSNVVKHEEAVQPSDMLSVIQKIVSDPSIDVAKMQALLDMHMQIIADQRKVAFDDAMTRLQATIPQIEKYGKGKNSRFAKYEDIEAICKPLWIAEGFSLSFNEEERTEDKVRFVLEVSRAGHSRFHRMTVSTDRAAKNAQGSSIRPAIQDDGSTAQYARRYLIKLALDIVEKDEDTDGENAATLNDDQAKDLDILMSDVRADKPAFLKWMGVTQTKDIRLTDLRKAIEGLEAKRRGK